MVVPAASALVAASWITGPSASGSENGTPSSSRSAPASMQASPTARGGSRSGNPPIRYGMRAACRPCEAKAAAMRSVKPEHLGQVFVSTARQRDQVRARAGGGECPGDRVRGLERRDDALEAAGATERLHCLVVGHRRVGRATGVAQVRVLWPDARVIEPGGDRVRLEDLPLL